MNDASDRRGGPYRSRNGKICGVCGGIAEHLAISPFWIRLAVVILFFMTGFWPVVVTYFVAALIMKPSPVRPLENNAERDFYEAYTRVPDYTIRQIYDKFKNLDRRLQRMEDTVTARAFEWDQKLNRT
jgi:phage shock protein C